MKKTKIFSGSSCKKLTKKITNILSIKKGKININKFNDGETKIEIKEKVYGHKIFIIQSTCSPTNDNLMELFMITDALKRASANKITAIIPYFGYARQDRKINSEIVPITGKMIANFIECSGIHQILTIDIHSKQIQGFFNIPIKNISINKVFAKDILKKYKKNKKFTIVAPDIGGIPRAQSISDLVKTKEISIIYKKRYKNNKIKTMNIIGKIKKNCILIDDIIDTGNTIISAAKTLKKLGAKKIIVYAIHPVFSKKFLKNFQKSQINKIIVCDTINITKKIKNIKNIKLLSISKILSKNIQKML